MHQCWVNDVAAPPGDIVSGTSGDDHIFCDSDLENVTVWGGGGNDMIEVRGLVIDSAVMGGEGDDVIRAKHLVPQNASSMVRGNRGNDVIKVATVSGDGAAHGAVVHGDDGDDKITTGSVTGAPGKFNRGGGIVTGNDGADTIKVGTIDFSGRVLGGSEADVIEAEALGPESGGLIQAGPGDDMISGPMRRGAHRRGALGVGGRGCRQGHLHGAVGLHPGIDQLLRGPAEGGADDRDGRSGGHGRRARCHPGEARGRPGQARGSRGRGGEAPGAAPAAHGCGGEARGEARALRGTLRP